MIRFEVKDKDAKARTGIIKSPKGEISTPLFVPQTTSLGVDGVLPATLKEIGVKALFADTYRLAMRVDANKINATFGGLGGYMNWEGLLLTDSGTGGLDDFPVYSKAKEEGVFFASYIDGSRHKITPESSIELQVNLGSDILTGLYERADVGGKRKKIGTLLRRTARWNRRARDIAIKHKDKLFFATITGGAYSDLRESSIKYTLPLKADGYLQDAPFKGENRKAWLSAVAYSTSLLPEDKPCAVRGIATPAEMLESIRSGIDIIFSSAPIEKAKQGIAFTDEGEINLAEPVFFDDASIFYKQYTKSYIHHLCVAKEILGTMLIAEYNIAYFNNFVFEAVNALKSHCFEDFMKKRGL